MPRISPLTSNLNCQIPMGIFFLSHHKTFTTSWTHFLILTDTYRELLILKNKYNQNQMTSYIKFGRFSPIFLFLEYCLCVQARFILFYFICSNLCRNQIGYHSQKRFSQIWLPNQTWSRKFKNPFTYWLAARAYYKHLEFFFTEIWQIRAIFQNEIHYYNISDFCVAKFLHFMKNISKRNIQS